MFILKKKKKKVVLPCFTARRVVFKFKLPYPRNFTIGKAHEDVISTQDK